MTLSPSRRPPARAGRTCSTGSSASGTGFPIRSCCSWRRSAPPGWPRTCWRARDFGLVDPRTRAAPQINDQLTVNAFAAFIVGVTQAFVTFPPLGMVLVMVIGVAGAERSGLVGGALRGVLSVASPRLLTPLVAVAALAGHVMSDGALIIVVPLAGALFYVAGRHPLAGILAGFAPLSGAMFANFFPYALDAVIAGFSESRASASFATPARQR